MVYDFGVVNSRAEVGFYAGLIVASFFLGQALSSYFWNAFVAKRGRKCGILYGLVSTSVISILFGMSPNVAWACFTRLLLGLTCSMKNMTRPLVADLATSPEMRNWAQNFLNVMENTGKATAIFIGGFMVKPENYGLHVITNSFLTNNPYVLPNLLVSGIAMLIFVLVAIYVRNIEQQADSESKPQGHENELTTCGVVCFGKVCVVLSIYAMICTIQTGVNSLVTIWLFAEASSFGFEMNPHQISIITGVAAFMLVLLQQTCIKRLVDRKGYISTLRIGFAAGVLMYALLPFASFLKFDTVLMYTGMIAMLIPVYGLISQSALSMRVLVNNSVARINRDKVNVINTSMSCFLRAVCCVAFCIGYTCLTTMELDIPLPHAPPFWVIALISLLAFGLSFRLTTNLETTPEANEEVYVELQKLSASDSFFESVVAEKSISPLA